MYPRKHYRFSRVRFFCFCDVKFAIVQPCRFDSYFAVWYHLRVVFLISQRLRKEKAQNKFGAFCALSNKQMRKAILPVGKVWTYYCDNKSFLEVNSRLREACNTGQPRKAANLPFTIAKVVSIAFELIAKVCGNFVKIRQLPSRVA